MAFHCRCNIKESECSYPECISGQRDMTIEKIDKIASELQDTCHKQAQRIAALEAELDDVKQVQFPRKLEAVAAGWATKLATVEKERDSCNKARLDLLDLNDGLCEQLAISQARNQQFRKVFEEYSHYAPKKEGHGLHEALSLPNDTSALDELVKDAVFSEREACAKLCENYSEWAANWGMYENELVATLGAKDCAGAIRKRSKCQGD
jgi:hypothetical protein